MPQCSGEPLIGEGDRLAGLQIAFEARCIAGPSTTNAFLAFGDGKMQDGEFAGLARLLDLIDAA